MVLLFVPVVAWAIHRTGITTGDYWGAIKPPLVSGFLGGVTGLVVKVALHNTLPPPAMLIFGLALSFAVYTGILLFVMGQKEMFADLLSHLFQRDRTLSAES
jgi:hypothetical protein